MTENFKYSGTWFLPHDKFNRKPGVLTYDKEDGCMLELFGNFNDQPYPDNVQEDIILGVTEDSREITLYNVFALKVGGTKLVTGREVGVPSIFYRVNYCLDGTHIDNTNELKFTKICCEIFNFEEWIKIDGFEKIEPQIPPNLEKINIDISYTSPASISFKIDEGLSGKIRFNVNFTFRQFFQKEAYIIQKNDLSIFSDDSEFTMNDLLESIHIFENFLTLALYSRTYTLKTYLYRKDTNSQIELYYPVRGRYKDEKKRITENMLFNYSDIEDDFPLIMERWFYNFKKIRPAFNLILEQFYSTERFSINNFLNLAQAIEALHKGITEIRSGEFHTRLSDLINNYFIDCLYRLIPDKEKFIEDIKISRNYYTHYSPNYEERSVKGVDLMKLTGRLQVFLVCVLLIETGIPKEKLNEILQNKIYQFFNNLYY